jgi:hypothetical protein
LPLHQLGDWGNFYVIVGSAAAGLTGLMFVVIALTAEVRMVGTEGGLSGFASPTVVHFCVVLLLAAVISSPVHTTTMLGAVAGICGAAGLCYVAWAMRQARRQSAYEPVLEDWVWHGGAPIIAYGALLAAAVLLWMDRPDPALYLYAATSLLLLFTGIRNAWDTAVWIATTKGREGAAADKSDNTPSSSQK